MEFDQRSENKILFPLGSSQFWFKVLILARKGPFLLRTAVISLLPKSVYNILKMHANSHNLHAVHRHVSSVCLSQVATKGTELYQI